MHLNRGNEETQFVFNRQRSYWIEIASEFPGTLIWLIVFDVPYEVSDTLGSTKALIPTVSDLCVSLV